MNRAERLAKIKELKESSKVLRTSIEARQKANELRRAYGEEPDPVLERQLRERERILRKSPPRAQQQSAAQTSSALPEEVRAYVRDTLRTHGERIGAILGDEVGMAQREFEAKLQNQFDALTLRIAMLEALATAKQQQGS